MSNVDMDNEDLEDGEIEEDDDDSCVIVDEPIKKSASVPKTEISMKTKSSSAPQKNDSYKTKKTVKNDNKFLSSSHRHHSPQPKKKRPAVVEDDFSAELEKALAMALKRDCVEPPLPSLASQKKNKKSDLEDDDDGDRSKSRKRKKKGSSDKNKKKSRNDDDKGRQDGNEQEELDEYEMLCVRGGSPPPNTNLSQHTRQNDFYESDHSSASSNYENENRKRVNYEEKRQRHRDKVHRDRKMRNDKRGGRNRGDSEGEECMRSHESRAPRKMELCKFYLMECCAKRENCLYMHSDFPCKYYYLGMKCQMPEKCVFMHGKPLTDQLRIILLKHLETAPKEILGDFPRLSHDTAVKMLTATHKKLVDELEARNKPAVTVPSLALQEETGAITNPSAAQLKAIPSLFDIQTVKPPNSQTRNNESGSANSPNNSSSSRSSSDKPRKSRWCDPVFTSLPPPSILSRPPPQISQPTIGISSSVAPPDYLCLKHLTGVITSEQIEVFSKIGITTLEQLNQLTVGQLNDLGISINQISDIQMNAKNIRQLGLSTNMSVPPPAINVNETSKTATKSSLDKNEPVTVLKDLDMRVTHPSAVTTSVTASDSLSFGGQDVDMRFENIRPINVTQSNEKTPKNEPLKINEIASPDHQPIFKVSTDTAESKKNNQDVNSYQSQHKSADTIVDYSQYLRDSNLMGKDDDHEENNREESDSPLLIDESWCPSDEEKNDEQNNDSDTSEVAKKYAQNDDSSSNLPLLPAVIDPTSFTKSNILNNLSKIDLSASVSKLLNTIHMNKTVTATENSNSESSRKLELSYVPIASTPVDLPLNSAPIPEKDTRDPRMRNIRIEQPSLLAANSTKPDQQSLFDNDNRVTSNIIPTTTASTTSSIKTRTSNNQRVSIYDQRTDDDDNDQDDEYDDIYGKKKTNDRDMRIPYLSSISSDFSAKSADVDLRLPLPFKPVHHHVPATEIDASISSYMPKTYKVHVIDIPTPRYRELRKNLKKPQHSLDPRLRRIFGLKDEDSDSDAMDPLLQRLQQKSIQIAEPTPIISPTTPAAAPPNSFVARIDPRRKKDANLSGTLSNVHESGPSSSHTLDIQSVIQKSLWYKDLSSKQKIMVNQQLALLSTEMKKFHQDQNPDKVFDLSFIVVNQYLQDVLLNLGIYINDSGNFIEIKDETESNNFPKNTIVAPPNLMGLPPLDFLHLPPPHTLLPQPRAGLMGLDNNLRFLGPPPMVFAGRPGLLGNAPPNVRFNAFVDPTTAVTSMIMGGGGGSSGLNNRNNSNNHYGGNNGGNRNQNNDRWNNNRNNNRRNNNGNNNNNNHHRRDRDNKKN